MKCPFLISLIVLISLTSCKRPQGHRTSGTIAGFGSEKEVYACAGAAWAKYSDESGGTWKFSTSKRGPSEFLIQMNRQDEDEQMELRVTAGQSSDSQWTMRWQLTTNAPDARDAAKMGLRFEDSLGESSRA